MTSLKFEMAHQVTESFNHNDLNPLLGHFLGSDTPADARATELIGVVAVVVTYNRLQLLQRCIDGLINQKLKPDAIIVVNNGSSDGTKEWLDGNLNIAAIHQENLGCGGGFSRGIQEAIARNARWVWCMDDDVIPDISALSVLLRECSLRPSAVGLACCRIDPSGSPVLIEATAFRFGSTNRRKRFDRLTRETWAAGEPVRIAGFTFEGILLRTEAVQSAGMPNCNFVTQFDDFDLSYRIGLLGDIFWVPNAKMYRQLSLAETSLTLNESSMLKQIYCSRNELYWLFNVARTSPFEKIISTFYLVRLLIGIWKYLLLEKHECLPLRRRLRYAVMYTACAIKGAVGILGKLEAPC